MKRPSIKQLMELTELSRATLDRALNQRPGVHPRTQKIVEQALDRLAASPLGSDQHPALRFRLFVQTGEAFVEWLSQRIDHLASEMAHARVQLDLVNCFRDSDEQLAARILQSEDSVDGIAIVGRNTAVTTAASRHCMDNGKAVISLVSDLEPEARHAFVGINNRAAGQSAGFLIGRHLQPLQSPNVAVIVATAAYIGHEDREIGFRSLCRNSFPNINILEVINGQDTDEANYEGVRNFIRKHGRLDGIYNVGGGNDGMAQALVEQGLAGRTVCIAHELDSVTERRLRSGAIDYVLSQDLDNLLRTAAAALKSVCDGNLIADQTLLPIDTYSRYSLRREHTG